MHRATSHVRCGFPQAQARTVSQLLGFRQRAHGKRNMFSERPLVPQVGVWFWAKHASEGNCCLWEAYWRSWFVSCLIKIAVSDWWGSSLLPSFVRAYLGCLTHSARNFQSISSFWCDADAFLVGFPSPGWLTGSRVWSPVARGLVLGYFDNQPIFGASLVTPTPLHWNCSTPISCTVLHTKLAAFIGRKKQGILLKGTSRNLTRDGFGFVWDKQPAGSQGVGPWMTHQPPEKETWNLQTT